MSESKKKWFSKKTHRRKRMADFHFSVTQIKRSAGQSAIAAAAYRGFAEKW